MFLINSSGQKSVKTLFSLQFLHLYIFKIFRKFKMLKNQIYCHGSAEIHEIKFPKLKIKVHKLTQISE